MHLNLVTDKSLRSSLIHINVYLKDINYNFFHVSMYKAKELITLIKINHLNLLKKILFVNRVEDKITCWLD